MLRRCLVWMLIGFAGVTESFAEERPARVFRHMSANGGVSSAIFLKAVELPPNPARRHIIIVDTSASQVGEYRLQTLAVVESLLQSLTATDQVRLFAADLRAEPMDEGFQNAQGPGISRSLELLKERVPLGATNLEGVLRSALESATDQPTDILYLGDGLSTADLIEMKELRALVADLRQRQVPVHGFGIGARRDLQLLGVLAQQTGGSIAFDALPVEAPGPDEPNAQTSKQSKSIERALRSSAERATEQGKGLAAALKAPIFFARSLSVSPEGVALLPSESLPIRTDRDTVYLLRGDVPVGTQISLADAEGTTRTWKLAAAVEQPGATFLPILIDSIEPTRGLTNPLAGLPLFLLAQSDFSESVSAFAQQGLQAIQSGELDEAARISRIVTERDPKNDQGQLLKASLERARAKEKPVRPRGTKPSR